MIVTEISELSKGRYKVFIDQEFAFVLYKGELRSYKIACEQEITVETVKMIQEQVLLKRAKLRCMNLLKTKDYTRYQLQTKLKQGLYADDIIEAALDYVASYHYIDDERYARAYIQYASSSKSKRKIEQDLLLKGVSAEVIHSAMEDFEADNTDQEEELIKDLLRKKHYSGQNATIEEKNKIIGYLYRKGFALDKVYRIIGKID